MITSDSNLVRTLLCMTALAFATSLCQAESSASRIAAEQAATPAVNHFTTSEIGTNDFRISNMGPDGNASYDAFNPAVAYNSTDDEYLIVWEGDDDLGTAVSGENEIWGKLRNSEGGYIDIQFRISNMGPDGNITYSAFSPDVAYNSTDNQYLVVWSGESNTGSLVEGEFEIWGEILNAAGGVVKNDFRISDMGPDGNTAYEGRTPAVSYNSIDNEYLVVWWGDDNTGTLVDGEYEIFGQRLTGAGAETGGSDFRISDMGTNGDSSRDAFEYPSVAYNSTDNQYLVVWAGDDVVDDEVEIYAQLLTNGGGETGTNDFRISTMGPDGDSTYRAREPDVVYNSIDNRYLVVWTGDDDSGILVNEEHEIFGQLLTKSGGQAGANDFRISAAGPDGNADYDSSYPAVSYDSTDNMYLVVWQADDNSGSLVDEDVEVWARAIHSTGAPVAGQQRISDMGADGDTYYNANHPAVVHNWAGNQFLVVWHGDDDTGSLVNGELEIYGQRLAGDELIAIDLVDLWAIENEGKVRIQWQTGYEIDNLGFHVYRQDKSGTHLITPSLVAGSALLTGTALTEGHSYVWIDEEPSTDPTVRYLVEEVSTRGGRTRHETGVEHSSERDQHNDLRLPQARSEFLTNTGLANSRGFRPEEFRPGPAEPDQSTRNAQRFIVALDGLKIRIDSEGWYRVTGAELVSAGLNPHVDPSNLQLWAEGRQVPILISGTEDGYVDGSDVLSFYGYGQDSPWSATRSYYLLESQTEGFRLSVPTAVAPSVPLLSTPRSFGATLVWEPRSTYFAALKNGSDENFFGPVVADEPLRQQFQPYFLDTSSIEGAKLELTMQGVLGEHLVLIELNGTEVGTLQFTGQESVTRTFSIPTNLLRAGSNTLLLRGDEGGEDISLLKQARLTYPRMYRARADRLSCTTLPGQEVLLEGFFSSEIAVLDVTDPNDVLILPGKTEVNDQGYAIRLTTPLDGIERRVLAVGSNGSRRFHSLQTNRPSQWWQETEGTQVVALTTSALEKSLAAWESYRVMQGYSVGTINVEDIYDEYGFGEKTPFAIREFLVDAWNNWRTRPEFLLLAGDASFDPRGYLGHASEDLLPTRILASTVTETASDNWYADLDGDGRPELAVGRLPVQTAEQLDTVLEKIIEYERTPERGDWRQQVTVVSDEQGQFDFLAHSEKLIRNMPAHLDVEEIWQGDPDPQRDVIQALQQGRLAVGYLGHGSIDRWAGRMLSSDEVATLENGRRLPFVLSMACLTGRFHDATESLGEQLLKHDGGGAIAVLASPSLDGVIGQSYLSEQVFEELFDGQNRTLGEVIRTAKRKDGISPDLQSYALLGDPLTRLMKKPPPTQPTRSWRKRR